MKLDLKIAILHPAFLNVGGAELLALGQAKCLRAQGFNVRIITSDVDMSRWSNDLNGIRTELLGKRDWLDKLGGRELWIARRSKRLSKYLTEVDVAIAHNYPMPRVLADTQAKSRKIWYCNEPYREIHLNSTHPTLASRRDAGKPANTMAERRFLRMYNRQRGLPLGLRHQLVAEGTRDLTTVDRLDLICANSKYARELAIRTYGPRDCRVVYPIVNFPACSSQRQGLDRQELRVLVHTRLVPEKNVDTVMRGFAKFIQSGHFRGQLHIVGEGPCSRELQSLARQLNIELHTTFHGFVSESELRRIYDSCEVFTLLSIDEPFGMVFPEAAARGLLLVGPSHGGPAEILEQGALGFVADAFSPEALADVYARVVALTDSEADALRDAAD